MDAFYVEFEKVLNVFMPTSWDLFQKLLILFVAFGVFLWLYRSIFK